jgi:hypothetical protein
MTPRVRKKRVAAFSKDIEKLSRELSPSILSKTLSDFDRLLDAPRGVFGKKKTYRQRLIDWGFVDADDLSDSVSLGNTSDPVLSSVPSAAFPPSVPSAEIPEHKPDLPTTKRAKRIFNRLLPDEELDSLRQEVVHYITMPPLSRLWMKWTTDISAKRKFLAHQECVTVLTRLTTISDWSPVDKPRQDRLTQIIVKAQALLDKHRKKLPFSWRSTLRPVHVFLAKAGKRLNIMQKLQSIRNVFSKTTDSIKKTLRVALPSESTLKNKANATSVRIAPPSIPSTNLKGLAPVKTKKEKDKKEEKTILLSSERALVPRRFIPMTQSGLIVIELIAYCCGALNVPWKTLQQGATQKEILFAASATLQNMAKYYHPDKGAEEDRDLTKAYNDRRWIAQVIADQLRILEQVENIDDMTLPLDFNRPSIREYYYKSWTKYEDANNNLKLLIKYRQVQDKQKQADKDEAREIKQLLEKFEREAKASEKVSANKLVEVTPEIKAQCEVERRLQKADQLYEIRMRFNEKFLRLIDELRPYQEKVETIFPEERQSREESMKRYSQRLREMEEEKRLRKAAEKSYADVLQRIALLDQEKARKKEELERNAAEQTRLARDEAQKIKEQYAARIEGVVKILLAHGVSLTLPTTIDSSGVSHVVPYASLSIDEQDKLTVQLMQAVKKLAATQHAPSVPSTTMNSTEATPNALSTSSLSGAPTVGTLFNFPKVDRTEEASALSNRVKTANVSPSMQAP